MKGDTAVGVPAPTDSERSEEVVCSLRASRACVHASCVFMFLALTLLMLVVMERERRMDAEVGVSAAWDAQEAEDLAYVMMHL